VGEGRKDRKKDNGEKKNKEMWDSECAGLLTRFKTRAFGHDCSYGHGLDSGPVIGIWNEHSTCVIRLATGGSSFM
jgi:hypothetical protein